MRMAKNFHVIMIYLSRRDPETSAKLTKDQFGNFFRENYYAACLVAMRYIPDISRAEDFVPDVFAALWEKRKSFGSGPA